MNIVTVQQNAAAAEAVQSALHLLRQDDVFTQASFSDGSVLTAKCKEALKAAANEIANAFSWSVALTSDVSAWMPPCYNALVYCIARELALPLAGRIEDLKTIDAIYRDKLLQSMIMDLTDQLAASTDPVLLQLVGNFRSDDAGLVRAFGIYTKRSSAIKTECESEVKGMLGISALDAVAKQACDCLAVARLCAACGIDANVQNLKLQEYTAKLNEWRKIKLNAALATNNDPVLAEIAMNFRSDDAGLANAFDVYTKRSSVIKTSAAQEIAAAHDWIVPFTESATSHRAMPAFHDLCCFKLVTALGFAADRCQVYATKFANNLQIAKAADLEAGKAAVTDADTKTVLALISTNFVAADGSMPRSISKITDRITQIKDAARKEVLLAQDWNFAKVVSSVTCTEPDGSFDDEYHFSVPYPAHALRIVTVSGYGRVNEWKIEGGLIRAMYPISSVKYTRDVDDMTKWSAFAKSAYVHRLAADVARTVMNNPQDAALQEQAYNLALENARVRDSRESSTPTDAWGDNYYARRMAGGFRPRHTWEWEA